ncbi:MAG TPA: hypothetical protein VJB15_03475 [Rhodothermia bacterium]|nr:hypothetical protein [Rhodothermia bacterium]
MSAEFQPLTLLRILREHGVDFIVVGGFAGNILGSPLITTDLDVCYARDSANLERVVAALRSLHARLRGAPSGLPFHLDVKTFENQINFTFETDAGPLDLLGEPVGVGGYKALAANADVVDLDGIEVLICALEDLIRMKRAAGRMKDIGALPTLEALREEIQARRSEE